jgi:protein phosphatase 2C family protein 2/3
MKDLIIGPLRVLPGRLSVSRTFGDVEAKHPKLGGNP